VTTRDRKFGLIVLGQAICLAVGLFMLHQLCGSQLRRTAVEQAWGTLEDAARTLAATESEAALLERCAATSEHGPDGYQAVLVDREWKPLSPGTDGAALSVASLPDNAAPTHSPGDAAASAGMTRGLLRVHGVPHLAVVWPRPGGEQRLVLHWSRDAIERGANTALPGLWGVTGITFLWTMALLVLTLYLLTSRHREILQDERARSASLALRQSQEVIRARDAVVFALGKLAGSRDYETGAHLERIAAYSTLIATALRDGSRYASEITPAFVRLIELSSVLHDIGKVGIEDRVLRKSGPLTESEREHMQQHTLIAGQCLGEIALRLGGSKFLEMARAIALGHHEHWDGSGYPTGLKGEQIPLPARIVAVADVYDALVTARVYKQPVSHRESMAIICRGSGRQFDPEIVAALRAVERDMAAITARHLASGEIHGRFLPEPAADVAQPATAAAADVAEQDSVTSQSA
jgi:HD-GYP domain-containing protein (c-di-GMP phosphodiesterase class II)